MKIKTKTRVPADLCTTACRNEISFSDYVSGFGQVAHVFFLGTDQHVYQLWNQNNGAWNLQDMTMMTGAPVAAPGSFLAGYADDVPGFGHDANVAFLGTNQHVYFLWWSTNDWAWHDQDLNQAANNVTPAQAGTALTSFGDMVSGLGNTQNVFYHCSNGDLCQLWWSTGGTPSWQWSLQDMTSLAGSTVSHTGSALTSFVK